MLTTMRVKHEKRAQVPAVLHMDGSSRVQILHKEDNPLFHQLITSFKVLTGIPMVLNTSFNDSEPIVCRPGEALECFLRTEMDMLVLGNLVVER